MFSPVFYLNLYFILLLCNLVHSHGMKYIPDDWVDPTDMRNYDRINKKMKLPSSNVKSKAQRSATAGDNCTDYARDLRRFEIFLERFINHVLSTANLKNKVMKPNTRISSEIPVLIKSEELSRLTKLSEKITAANLNELDELFSSVFTDDRDFSFDSLTPYLNPLEQLFFNLSYEKISVLVFIMVLCVVMWMFAVGRGLKKIIIFLYLTFFMAGLGWNWWKMYQEAVIEQYTERQRLSQIPDICLPKKMGFFEYIFSSSSGQEDCHKYHTAFKFNPFSKVPPTIVLSETVTGMLVYPLKALGASVGEFLSGVNNAASWPFKVFFLPFVFIILILSLLCIIIVSLGVKLNFWTLLGGVSIGGRTQEKSSSHPTITDEISLRRTIEYDSENNYVTTQVGTIRRCITAVHNEVSMSPIENPTSFISTIRHRCFSTASIFSKNVEYRDRKLNFPSCNTLHHSNNEHRYNQNASYTQNESPGVSNFENKNNVMPSTSCWTAVQINKKFSTPEQELSVASGDSLSCSKLDYTSHDIEDHWNNILRQLNSNIKRKIPTPKILNPKSIILKKKNK